MYEILCLLKIRLLSWDVNLAFVRGRFYLATGLNLTLMSPRSFRVNFLFLAVIQNWEGEVEGGGMGKSCHDSSAGASAPGVADADADVDASEDDIGGWGNLFVNLYYALVNLGIMLGSLALLMVAYWLLKWATVRTCSAPPTNTAHIV